MRGIIFTAMLCLGGACALFAGSMALYDQLNYHFNGRTGMMELADKGRKVTIPEGGYDAVQLDVRYVGPAGDVLVSQKWLSGARARQLAKGEQLLVTYLKGHPETVLYQGDELPNPWGWLVAGIALVATGIYARKLLHEPEQ